MPVVHVTREVHFNAAHRLHNPARPDAWNADTFGACNSPNWHGHNYVLHVTVAGEPDPETGYVVDLGRLKEIVHEQVVRHVDHRNLNLDVDFLQGVLPSAENLAVAFWQRIAPHVPGGRLHRIRLFETPRNFVDYFGE
jgi:6-pyruvoyltetrahydropterin/6-carboxytetrahydropterin synthase